MPDGDEILDDDPAFIRRDRTSAEAEITLPGQMLTGEHAEAEARVRELMAGGLPEPAAREAAAVEAGTLGGGSGLE